MQQTWHDNKGPRGRFQLLLVTGRALLGHTLAATANGGYAAITPRLQTSNSIAANSQLVLKPTRASTRNRRHSWPRIIRHDKIVTNDVTAL